MDNMSIGIVCVFLGVLVVGVFSANNKLEKCVALLSDCANSLDSMDGKIGD
jgi:hypothetical protein